MELTKPGFRETEIPYFGVKWGDAEEFRHQDCTLIIQ